MMSKVQPCFRAMASAFGTFGDSMKPKCSTTRMKLSPSGSISTRFLAATRGTFSVMMVRITL
jgi:hypothetical protein